MNRPVLLKQTLKRLFETTQGIDVEAVVVIDECKESMELCYQMLLEGKNIFFSFRENRRGAINAWNYGLRVSDADIAFHQGDDLSYEDGWLDKALVAHREKLGGYGMVAVNDSMHNGNVIGTHVLFDKKFCREVLGGVMAAPIIKYYGVDVILNELAKKAGRYYWCQEAVVRHIHPANNGRLADATDASHQDFWTDDQNALDAWRSRGMKIEWEGVI